MPLGDVWLHALSLFVRSRTERVPMCDRGMPFVSVARIELTLHFSKGRSSISAAQIRQCCASSIPNVVSLPHMAWRMRRAQQSTATCYGLWWVCISVRDHDRFCSFSLPTMHCSCCRSNSNSRSRRRNSSRRVSLICEAFAQQRSNVHDCTCLSNCSLYSSYLQP